MNCKNNYPNCTSLNGCYLLGPTGPKGMNGTTGPTGPAPQLSIGTVTTGLPGTQASVKITPYNPS